MKLHTVLNLIGLFPLMVGLYLAGDKRRDTLRKSQEYIGSTLFWFVFLTLIDIIVTPLEVMFILLGGVFTAFWYMLNDHTAISYWVEYWIKGESALYKDEQTLRFLLKTMTREKLPFLVKPYWDLLLKHNAATIEAIKKQDFVNQQKG